jgi:hypothetical protein
VLAPATPQQETTRVELADRDRAILDLERTWWLDGEVKGDAIRRRVRLSPSRYYRLLQDLLENPAAMAYDPLVVRRLRRERSARRRARIEGTWASTPPRR